MPTYICKEEAMVVFLEYFATIKNEEQRNVLRDVYEKIKALPQYEVPMVQPSPAKPAPFQVVPLPNRPNITPLPADIPTFPITHYVKTPTETIYYYDN